MFFFLVVIKRGKAIFNLFDFHVLFNILKRKNKIRFRNQKKDFSSSFPESRWNPEDICWQISNAAILILLLSQWWIWKHWPNINHDVVQQEITHEGGVNYCWLNPVWAEWKHCFCSSTDAKSEKKWWIYQLIDKS